MHKRWLAFLIFSTLPLVSLHAEDTSPVTTSVKKKKRRKHKKAAPVTPPAVENTPPPEAIPAASKSPTPAPALDPNAIRIETISTIGVPAERGDAVKALLTQEVQANGKVLSEDKAAPSLLGTFTKLDKDYLLSLLYVQGAERRTRQVRLKSFDEIDGALHRLVPAVLNNTPVAEAPAAPPAPTQPLVGGAPPPRYQAMRGFEFFLGMGFPFNDAYAQGGQMWNLAFGYAWDVRNVFVDLRYDLLSRFGKNRGGYHAVTLGANYIWYENLSVSVFSGAEFGFARATDSLGDQTGFHYSGDIGILLLRQADVNFDARFRIGSISRSLTNGTPVLGTFQVGLHF